MSPLAKAIIWYIWNMIFGLAPFIVFGYLWMAVNDPNLGLIIREEITHLIRDLIFTFYCVAVIGSLSLNLLFCKHKYPNHIYFLMGATPCTIFGVVALHYSILVLNKPENANITQLIITQTFILLMTTTFCVFTKRDILRREEKPEYLTIKKE